MLEPREHRRILLRELRRNIHALGEHRRILEGERSSLRSHRELLKAERHQHHQVIAEIREHLSKERRYHKEMLAANKWLLALVDAILARQKARQERQAKQARPRRAGRAA